MGWLRVCLLLASVTPLTAAPWRWANPTPHGNDIIDMSWNGFTCLQVGELGRLYVGYDFTHWSPRETGTTKSLQTVKFFGDRILFGGAEGTIGYSDDGLQFTPVSLNTTNWIVDIAVSPSLAVAVGDNAAIYTSQDGASWELQTKPPSVSQRWLLSAAWGEGVFVTTGEGGYVATSGDGMHWTNRSLGISGNVNRVTWVTNSVANAFPYRGFWAVTDDGRAYYSTNRGSNWRRFSGLNTSESLYGIVANGSNAIFAGDSELLLGTSASKWQRQLGSASWAAPDWTYYNALADTNGNYFVGGEAGLVVQGSPRTGGYEWTLQSYAPRDWLWQITSVKDLYVAVGNRARIMTSQNGVDWSVEALPETNSVSTTNTVWLCVGGNTNMLVAAGNQGAMAISPDDQIPLTVTNSDGSLSTNYVSSLGVNWIPLPPVVTNDLAAVCFYSNAFFIAGGNGTLLRSEDGTNWAGVDLPTSVYVSGLAASGDTLVATGDRGTILTSSDGLVWTNQASGTSDWLFRVRYLNQNFIAVGENGTILTSTNAVAWANLPPVGTNWLNDAVSVGNTVYVVGNGGTVLASTDLTQWTPVDTITAKALYGAASVSGQLIVVGRFGTILREQVIPSVSPVSVLRFSQDSGYNVFLFGGKAGQQFTLDSSSDLLEWTTVAPLEILEGSGTLVLLWPVGTNQPTAQFYRTTLVR